MKRFTKVKKTLKEPKLILVRHGTTDFNNHNDKNSDRIRGWINVPLNEDGIKDAVKAAKDLRKYSVDVMYSSDLVRAEQTATIIHQDWPTAPLILSSNFRPWNLGTYQGKITADVIDDLNRMVQHEDIVPPEGESFKEFRTRYLTEIRKLADLALTKNKQIVVVTHYRNLKTVDAWITLGAPDDLSIDKEVMITDTFKPGEIYEVDLDKLKK